MYPRAISLSPLPYRDLGQGGTVFPHFQRVQPFHESSGSLGPKSLCIPGPGPVRRCLLFQTKVTQSTAFKRQDVGCKLPACRFKGNLPWQHCLLGCFPKPPWEVTGHLKGLIIDTHVQFPKYANLKSECYFSLVTFELLCRAQIFY